MSTGRYVAAALLSGVTLFIVGFLLWGLILSGFFDAHMVAPPGFQKETVGFISLLLGQIFWGIFLTVAIGSWAQVSGLGAGFRIGAIAGLLLSLSVGLTQYSMANLNDLTATLVDPIVSLLWSGAGGAVVGLMLGRGPETTGT